jgi:hypothetical protein
VKRKIATPTKDLGRVDLFLDDILDITRLFDEAMASVRCEDRPEVGRITVECADHELTPDELPQLEGKTTRSFQLIADTSRRCEHLRLTFSDGFCSANGYATDVATASLHSWVIEEVTSYLDRHCRPPRLRRSFAGDICVIGLVVFPTVAVLASLLEATVLHGRGQWAIYMMCVPLAFALSMLIQATWGPSSRPSARIRLIRREKHASSSSTKRMLIATIAAVIVTLLSPVLGVVLSHAWPDPGAQAQQAAPLSSK